MLRYAHEKPKLTRWSDNVRILELLAQNDIMDEQEALALTRAYTTLRDELHHLALQELAGPCGAGALRPLNVTLVRDKLAEVAGCRVKCAIIARKF